MFAARGVINKLLRTKASRSLQRHLLKKARKSDWRVVLFGTDQFSVAVAEQLRVRGTESASSARISALSVVVPQEVATVSADRRGTQPLVHPLRAWARTHRLPAYTWREGGVAEASDTCQLVNSIADLVLVASFGMLVPSHVISGATRPPLNVHPSLLPHYMGAAPIRRAMLHGDTLTGVSLITLHPHKFDQGLIVDQLPLTIDPFTESYQHVLTRCAHLGADMLIDRVLPNYDDYIRKARAQPAGEYRRAPKLKTEEGAITWLSMNARHVVCRFNALGDNPGVYCQLTAPHVTRVNLLQVSLVEDSPLTAVSAAQSPGSVVYDKSRGRLLVTCAENSVVQVSRLQLAGRRALTAVDFANGQRMVNGQVYSKLFH
jgi:methionyl-tRNA formyltransferase